MKRGTGGGAEIESAGSSQKESGAFFFGPTRACAEAENVPEFRDWSQTFDHLDDSTAAYLKQSRGIREELAKEHDSSELMLINVGPSSLGFVAGTAASQSAYSRLTLPVYTKELRYSGDSVSVTAAEPNVPPSSAMPDHRLRNRWWLALLLDSVGAGLLVPILVGAVTLLLEWLVVSPPESIAWPLLKAAGASIVAGGLLIMIRRLVTKNLTRPTFIITDTELESTLTKRVIQMPEKLDDEGAEAFVNAAHQAIVMTFPEHEGITIRLGSRWRTDIGPTKSLVKLLTLSFRDRRPLLMELDQVGGNITIRPRTRTNAQPDPDDLIGQIHKAMER